MDPAFEPVDVLGLFLIGFTFIVVPLLPTSGLRSIFAAIMLVLDVLYFRNWTSQADYERWSLQADTGIMFYVVLFLAALVIFGTGKLLGGSSQKVIKP